MMCNGSHSIFKRLPEFSLRLCDDVLDIGRGRLYEAEELLLIDGEKGAFK